MSALQKLDNGTIQLTITIPQPEVKKTWDEVVDATVKQTNVAGFRKGKAPKKLVEENIDTEKVREEVLKKLLPEAYIKAVGEHNLKPIMNPRIHIEKVDEEGTKDLPAGRQGWQFIAQTCEAPEVTLSDYKTAIQKLTAKSKIIIPGKEQEPPKFDEIIQALLQSVKVKIPEILITQEVDRLLSQMLDEIKTLGLNLEQYLASTKKTAEDLRNDYRKKAEADIALEFALQKIADVEKISIEEKEVEEAIQKAKDDTERKNLEANRYLLASILRQQKTLDFLKNL